METVIAVLAIASAVMALVDAIMLYRCCQQLANIPAQGAAPAPAAVAAPAPAAAPVAAAPAAAAPAAAAPVAPVSSVAAVLPQEVIAAVSAALAEDLGTDVSRIRIKSVVRV